MERITIGCKVDIETGNQIKEEARRLGISLNEYVKQKLQGSGMTPEFNELYVALGWACVNKDAEECCRMLLEKINSGEISFSDKGIYLNVESQLNLKNFMEACEEKGIDAQKKLDEVTRTVWNMRTGGAGGA